jgi:DNA integrity scanning protein DisA with diadenylate cyclase activity
LLDHLTSIVRSCCARAVFIYADVMSDDRIELPDELKNIVFFYTCRTVTEQSGGNDSGPTFISVPDVKLSRTSQANTAVFQAFSAGMVRHGDVIVCLTGAPDSGTFDTLIATEIGNESAILTSMSADHPLPTGVQPQVAERVMEIALELGTEGREGKPVGALFVIGDAERVVALSRQLILNPFKGYIESERHILDPNLEETVKELSTIDGAFVIDGNGAIVTAGAYVKTVLADEDEYSLPQGLGARHHAAAGITTVTDSIAITVSESTGTVTAFRKGRIVTQIEKPRTQRSPVE